MSGTCSRSARPGCRCRSRDSRAGNWPAAGGVRDLAAQVERTGFTGWYFRVLQEGVVEAGMELETLERPFPEWPLALAARAATPAIR